MFIYSVVYMMHRDIDFAGLSLIHGFSTMKYGQSVVDIRQLV